MTKIKSLTLTNFGPFRGTHKISFSTDEKRNLTVVFGGYTLSFGPPSITGGDSTSFSFTTMISDAIRETLGVNATKNWPEWYPEHYQNPGASLDVEEEGGAAISRETEILYFFQTRKGL